MVFSVFAISVGAFLFRPGNNEVSPQASLDAPPATTTPLAVTQGDNVDRFLPIGAVTTLATEDLVVGEGEAVVATDKITVHYTGWLATDGTVFDSSVNQGQPVTFPLSGVILGWQEGIPGMQVGGVRRIVIPAEMAYGPQARNLIPANSDLVFEVELIRIGQ